MRLFRSTVLLLIAIAATQAMAWGSHALATYRAFEKMPEVANAPVVTVEPLEAFLRLEENTIEALLASEEAWARSNLDKYPARPAPLAFVADPARSDESRRTAFLMALRVAPNAKFALYYQPDPWNPTSGSPLPLSAVSTLPESGNGTPKFISLKVGEAIPVLAVLASAAEEPDFGLDINLWEDSPSDWGKQYGFGTQPFGNPSLTYATQAPFHMGFMHESRILYVAAPFIKRTYPRLRFHQFSTLASLAFRTDHAYWGWRFAGLALHYLQDLTQPYHATLAPGEPASRLLLINALAMAGMGGMKDEMTVLLSNRHLVLEKYESELLERAASIHQEGMLEKALHNTDRDRTYPEWNDHYLRDVVSLQANHAAASLVTTLLATMPANYVSNPGFDFGVKESGINLLNELAKQDASDRSRLEAAVAELMGNFGSHSRNAIRGILRASSPP
jgi:hypothetical protein